MTSATIQASGVTACSTALSSQGLSQQRRTAALLVFNGLMLLWLFLKPCRHSVFTAVADIAGAVGPLIGALWCLWPSRQPENVRRQPRFLLGLGILCYGIGGMIWSYYEVWLRKDTPFPSWADAAYLLAYPCLLFGILRLPARPLPLALRGRVVLDSLMTMAALVTFSWYFLLGPILLKSGQTILCKALSAGYPLGDLVLLFCLLVLSAHPEEAGLRRAVPRLSLGIVLIVIVDSLFGYMSLHNTYASGGLMDVLWPIGYMLVALGACEPYVKEKADAAPPPAQTTAPRNPVLWRSLMPYALVPAVGLLLCFTVRHHGDERYELGVYIGSAVLVGLILVRQVFALLENGQLNRFLRDAYGELEATSVETRRHAHEMEALKVALEMQNRSLTAANEQLAGLAVTDGLTGAKNHRAFQEQLRHECERADRHGFPLSLVMLDVDKFKAYNDGFGHPAGDEVLKMVARLLSENARDGDFVARYGGEEFVVLMPHTDGDAAVAVAERLRSGIEAAPWEHRAVTASFGLASLNSSEMTPPELMKEADRALYHAKSQGRNRVVHVREMP